MAKVLTLCQNECASQKWGFLLRLIFFEKNLISNIFKKFSTCFLEKVMKIGSIKKK